MDMKEYKKKYRKENAKRIKAYKKRYYAQNREKVLEKQKEYYESHKEERINYQRDYYQKNKSEDNARGKRYYQKNKNSIKKKNRQYQLENPEVYRKSCSNYRARKRNAPTEPWTHEEIAENGTGFCPYCGKEIGLVYDRLIMEIDHIIPLSRGGSNLKENLEPICCECNHRKNDKTKEEFLNENYGS
jgi:5-methylcytosine-specific restriction endonuclease McrA